MKYAYLLLKGNDNGRADLIESESQEFTLKELQRGVGGNIEIVNVKDPVDGRKLRLVIDDEGKIKGKRVNLRASLLYGSFYDCIVGDAILGKEIWTDDGPDVGKLEKEEAMELQAVINERLGDLKAAIK